MSDEIDTVTLATELTIAWLSNPNTRSGADDVPAFLSAMHSAVTALANPVADTAGSEESVPDYCRCPLNA